MNFILKTWGNLAGLLYKFAHSKVPSPIGTEIPVECTIRSVSNFWLNLLDDLLMRLYMYSRRSFFLPFPTTCFFMNLYPAHSVFLQTSHVPLTLTHRQTTFSLFFQPYTLFKPRGGARHISKNTIKGRRGVAVPHFLLFHSRSHSVLLEPLGTPRTLLSPASPLAIKTLSGPSIKFQGAIWKVQWSSYSDLKKGNTFQMGANLSTRIRSVSNRFTKRHPCESSSVDKLMKANQDEANQELIREPILKPIPKPVAYPLQTVSRGGKNSKMRNTLVWKNLYGSQWRSYTHKNSA